jgi:signal peptidase I
VRYLDRSQGWIPQPWRTIVDWLVTIVVAIAAVLAFEAEVAKPYRIPSPSMEPTLHCAHPVAGCRASNSDRVLVNRLAYRFRDPKRGEIVVFHTPDAAKNACGISGTYVKRLIGLPGDVVSERNGDVYVNGRRLDEPYVRPELRDRVTQRWPRVADGHYFLLGDNRASSCDSRRWGTVPRKSLIGPVLLTYWPPMRLAVR